MSANLAFLPRHTYKMQPMMSTRTSMTLATVFKIDIRVML